jgi:hypothetical protein
MAFGISWDVVSNGELGREISVYLSVVRGLVPFLLVQ